MRLINADELKCKTNTGYFHRMIDDCKTVDAVPVVRCKDCRCFERQGEYNGGISYGYCYHWDYEQGGEPNMVDGNDFCSYGEKKDDVDNASG